MAIASRLPAAQYSRRSAEALERGEPRDPESIDLDVAAPSLSVRAADAAYLRRSLLGLTICRGCGNERRFGERHCSVCDGCCACGRAECTRKFCLTAIETRDRTYDAWRASFMPLAPFAQFVVRSIAVRGAT